MKIKDKDEIFNVWVSFTDLLTGIFMVSLFVFLVVLLKDFIAIKRLEELEKIVKKIEKEQEDLKQLAGENIAVTDDGRVILSADVFFTSGSAVLKPGAVVILESVGKKLSEFLREGNRKKRFTVIVEGHTDTVYNHLFNQDLSFQRAKAVVNFWKDNVSGLDSWWATDLDLFPAGFGETRLRAKTPDNTPNAQNRRIEIRVVPKFNEILKEWTKQTEL